MNGDHETMAEPSNEVDGQLDSNGPDNASKANEVTSELDSKDLENLTNGTSCQNSPKPDSPKPDSSIADSPKPDSPKPDSHDNEESVDESSEDTNEIDSVNLKSPVDSHESLSQKVTNGDDTSDAFTENTDSVLVNDSMETSNNSHKLDTSESIDNNSTDFQEASNKNTDSEHILMDDGAVNGLEFNHNTELTFQYLDDAEDPISAGEPKEEQNALALEKYDSKDSETGTFKIVTINRYHSDGENSSDCSGSEDERRADTVSITSDGDDSREYGLNKTNDIIIIENETDNRNGAQSPEIHEINSGTSDIDDCVVTGVEKIKTPKKKSKTAKALAQLSELRRSSRAVKRKNYEDEIEELDDDESDLEEVCIEDPLQNKSLNSNKSLLSMTSKLKRKLAQKKGDVIIISPPKKIVPAKQNSDSHQNIYQKIAARGISVTPISAKAGESKAVSIPITPAVQPPPEPILPTLTDDMFVVEAPSFIVPYVYEKPAVVPFKEFVDKWGKEIEEEKAKEEQELLEKKKAEKAKRDQERQEKRERGEEVQESEEEDSEEVKKKKADKAERKERRRRKKEDDDVSWDGSSSEDSDDESLSDDDSQTKENIIKDIKEGPATTPKTDSYFDLSLGKFFMDIGANLVQQHVQTDLLHQQNKKLRREKKTGHSTRSRQLSIALLTKNLELSQKTNASFTFEEKKCKFCSFKTESQLVMQHHMETPHMKNNVYICSFCSLEFQSPHNILYHMEMNHGVKGRMDLTPAQHQCVNCPFEDHGKGKLARHALACAKRFKPDTNLAPPVEWEHPAKIPKLTRARGPMYQQGGHFVRLPSDTGNSGNMRIQIGNAITSPSYRPRGPAAAAPMRPSGILIRPAPQPSLTVGNLKKNSSILISPSPRQASPIQPLNATNAKGVVMCEICDGYIKDLEQLRNHMQWIHKVKIHPKMIYNRPPLNCQKCQFRFFTDQGLERHLLGSHGLVTSAIQEAANKGKDAGRCPVCGRAYQRKLLAHVSRDHNLVLKPAHLSYKCTVCTATFGMYRQFENHVYSAHSVVAKKVIDKKAAAKATPNDATTQLNNEVSITPQPIKIAAAKGK